MNPKVSIIIPSFNGLRRCYLGACLASATAQTLPPHEILFIDDGSSDGTAAWVRANFPTVTVISQPNQGVSAARNRALAAASGELIAFLDDDDTWHPEKLARQAAFLAAHPAVGMTYCGMDLVDPTGTVLRTQVPTGLGLTWPEILLSNHIFTPSTVMVRKTVTDAVGPFDPTLKICEDYDFYIRCAQQARIVGMSDVLVRYQCHGAQASHSLQAIDRATLVVIARHATTLPAPTGERILAFVRAGAVLRAAVRRDFAESRALAAGLPPRQLWLLCLRAAGLSLAPSRALRSAWRRLETQIVLA